MEDHKKHTSLRHRLHEIIYEADTPSGKLFDVVLLIAILVSVLFVMLESIDTVADEYGELLNISEWIITILFSIEYILRIVSIKKPWKYIFSFYGIIDFLSTIPKYIAFFVVGSHNLAALRALRLLRVFRILKLTRYIGESNRLVIALKNSRVKISVFLFFVLIICIILGTVMYMIEGEYNDDFTSAPRGVYWAIVTLTTVGYGDIHPITVGGQFIASIVMIMGYAIIAIPTGIVSSEMFRAKVHVNTQACPHCLAEEHPDGAIYCYNCGEKLNE